MFVLLALCRVSLNLDKEVVFLLYSVAHDADAVIAAIFVSVDLYGFLLIPSASERNCKCTDTVLKC